MVELGPVQAEENASFAAHAPPWPTTWWWWAAPTDVPCCRGPGVPPGDAARLRVVVVRRVPEATALGPRRTSGRGDVVLYENDLPDHYP